MSFWFKNQKENATKGNGPKDPNSYSSWQAKEQGDAGHKAGKKNK